MGAEIGPDAVLTSTVVLNVSGAPTGVWAPADTTKSTARPIAITDGTRTGASLQYMTEQHPTAGRSQSRCRALCRDRLPSFVAILARLRLRPSRGSASLGGIA